MKCSEKNIEKWEVDISNPEKILTVEGENISEQEVKELVEKGTFGFGVFECNDLYATYEELKAKGVEFTKPPTKEFYGFEALFKDDSGNWFSLGQKKSD